MRVETWLDRLSTESTRDVYELYLTQFFDYNKTEPQKTLEWGEDTVNDKLLDFKAHLEKRGLAGSTIRIAWAAVKKWFEDNRITITVKCKGIDRSKTFLDYIPDKRDVERVLDYCSPTYKLGVSLIAFSGMRPIDACNLKYENIKASYEKDEIPLTIYLKQQKTGEWYATFLGAQGLKHLKTLLDERRSRGEEIADDTYIVSDDGERVNSDTFCDTVKYALEQTVGRNPTGEPFRLFRPYGFRKYFRRTTRKLGEDTAEFLMGHVVGIESLSAIYSGLRDLDPKAIEELRQEYTNLLPELETELSEETVTSEIKTLREEKEALEERVQMLENLSRDSKSLIEYMQQEGLIPPSFTMETPPSEQQKVIPESELEEYLNHGWLYVNSLNNGSGKCIIKR